MGTDMNALVQHTHTYPSRNSPALNSPSVTSTPDSRSPNPEVSYGNQDDSASLNDIVSKASEKMVNITNSTSSLKAATSIHSLRDLNSLSNWLQGGHIKLDKATDREQELIKEATHRLGEVFENAFDLSLSQSNSQASSRRGSVSSERSVESEVRSGRSVNSTNDNDGIEQRGLSIEQRGLSIDQRSMHEEFENTPRQTISSTPRS